MDQGQSYNSEIICKLFTGHYLNKQAAIMKITFLTVEWTQSTKGSCSTFMRQMAIELSRLENVEIGILIPSASPEDKEDAQKYNIKVFESEKILGFEPIFCLQFPPQGFSTDFIIGQGNELVHVGQALKNELSCKWVYLVLENSVKISLFTKVPPTMSSMAELFEIESNLCKKADMVITVGSKLNNTLSSILHQCKEDHIFNLIPGIFDELFGEQKQCRNSRTFEILVFVRGNTEGLRVAAEAVAHLNKYEPSYILKVGVPEGEQEKLALRLQGFGISRSQLIVRSLSNERRKLAQLFSEVDLVLMPSAGTEAFGLTALEALSAGVPILITHNSGLAKALEEVPFGHRCIVHQEADWAEKIKQARKNLETGLYEASMLRDNYKERYSWWDQCAAFVKKLRTLHSGCLIICLY